MSYNRMVSNPSDTQQRAWQTLTWEQTKQHLSSLDRKLTETANQYGQQLNNIKFTRQAVDTLSALNEFDRMMVLKDCKALSKNPQNPKSRKNRYIPYLRFIKSQYGFGNYHYKIRYLLTEGNKVVIDDFVVDEKYLGHKNPSRLERTAIYLVRRANKSKRIHKDLHYKELESLHEGWNTEHVEPVTNISGNFAAVNGMNNSLKKAMWLMGVHLDWAYQNHQFDSYYLVHNPSEDTIHDLWECGWDKSFTSLNANHLSAIMVKAAKVGIPIKWVAHSQGGIILLRALKVINERTNISYHISKLLSIQLEVT
ncbi:hypothetical protein [Aliikangiella maris]|uniref:Uncharacterized protein n=2 Tax=Aliikangiella maris TaxID=3162458 RepID=A0ABV2BPR9_9GAMM